MQVIQLFIVLGTLSIASSFSAPSPATKNVPPWQGFLDNLFQAKSSSSSNNAAKNAALKEQLLTECRQSIGSNTPEIRQRIENIITDLAPLNPTQSTAQSALLKRKWILEWTSEKEINFFLQQGISDEIIQTLSDDGVLENYIPFVKGGGFGVTGEIYVDEEKEGLDRTLFKFKNANLNLGRWGEYNFPPVGEGWFDTIYLDEGKVHRYRIVVFTLLHNFCNVKKSPDI